MWKSMALAALAVSGCATSDDIEPSLDLDGVDASTPAPTETAAAPTPAGCAANLCQFAHTDATGALTIGQPAPYPTGQKLLRFPNLDENITAEWGITQAWFPTGLERNDPMMFMGYNFDENSGLGDTSEPGWGIQLESYDVSAEGDPLLAAHLTLLTTAGKVVRPWSASVLRDSNVADLSFANRNTIFTDQNDHLLLHLAYGSSPTIGVGTQCNPNANFHVLGRNLWESNLDTASADGKKWDWSYGGMSGVGDDLVLRAVNDNYSAGAPVFQIARTGAAVNGVTFTPPVTLAGGLANLPVHEDNAAALLAGLAVGQVYRTSTGVLMVTY